MLQLLLGEVAKVIATGQKVLPAKALQLGYSFRYPDLAGALREIFTRKPKPSTAPAHSVPAGAGSHH